MKAIKEYRYICYLYRMMFEEGAADWPCVPLEVRLKTLEDWNLLREFERIGLEDKARVLRFLIHSTLMLASLAGSAMLLILTFSLNNEKYLSVAMLFGVHMLAFLAMHFVAVLWRWLWSLKLRKLALYIPAKYE